MIRALVFDLDDTLYPEQDFLVSGYRAVARHIAGISGSAFEEVCAVIGDTLVQSGRRAVMPALCARFPGPAAGIDSLVAVYRGHDPDIRLFPGCEGLLRRLRSSYRLGILTDGLPEVQQRKCRALGLPGLVDEIVCTWQNGEEKQKPHPEAFRCILARLRVSPEEALMIGDQPEKDCRGAQAAGMKSVLISPADAPDLEGAPADAVIESLSQLPWILEQMGGCHEAA